MRLVEATKGKAVRRLLAAYARWREGRYDPQMGRALVGGKRGTPENTPIGTLVAWSTTTRLRTSAHVGRVTDRTPAGFLRVEELDAHRTKHVIRGRWTLVPEDPDGWTVERSEAHRDRIKRFTSIAQALDVMVARSSRGAARPEHYPDPAFPSEELDGWMDHTEHLLDLVATWLDVKHDNGG